MSFFIVSGLSGSGKSIALQALEDMGFYCVDNLPAALLPHFAHEILHRHSDVKNAAVGIDARNRSFLDGITQSLAQLEAYGMHYRVLYLEADEAVLVKRFKETRRKHPLAGPETPLLEGIRLERQLLEPLAFHAHRRIDTTHTRPHELRQLLHGFVEGGTRAGVTLLFQSFGYKHGTPLDADFVFDVRCLPNPYWEQGLRNFCGRDAPVIEYLEKHPEVQDMLARLGAFLEHWLPSFERELRNDLTIAIGCTGGQHRSVYIAERLAAHFKDKGHNTQIRHRELA